MQTMIFAAGLGTRLKPLTDTMPKALVRVGGMPLLAYVVRKLTKAGCSRMVVNVHHFADQITDYLETHDFGVKILVSDETERLLDTGGGIKRAAPLFDRYQPVLVHNVDILSNVDLAGFYRHASMSEADVLLLVSHRITQRYLIFDKRMRLAGWTNVATGEVKSPHQAIRRLHFVSPEVGTYCQNNCFLCAFSGIHVLSPSAVQAVEAEQEDVFPIMDFYLSHCGRMEIHGELKTDLQLVDVGKLNTLQAAEDFIVNSGHQVSRAED